ARRGVTMFPAVPSEGAPDGRQRVRGEHRLTPYRGRRRGVIELERLPELVDPVLIAAFEGWNDAGEASSGALAHLEAAWKATPLVALDPEDYYDFQVTRPTIEMRDGGETPVIT